MGCPIGLPDRRNVCVVAVAAFSLVAVLAGCGGGGDSPAPSDPPETTRPADPAASEPATTSPELAGLEAEVQQLLTRFHAYARGGGDFDDLAPVQHQLVARNESVPCGDSVVEGRDESKTIALWCASSDRLLVSSGAFETSRGIDPSFPVIFTAYPFGFYLAEAAGEASEAEAACHTGSVLAGAVDDGLLTQENALAIEGYIWSDDQDQAVVEARTNFRVCYEAS